MEIFFVFEEENDGEDETSLDGERYARHENDLYTPCLLTRL